METKYEGKIKHNMVIVIGDSNETGRMTVRTSLKARADLGTKPNNATREFFSLK